MTYTCSQPRLYTTILQCLFELCKVSDQVTSVLSQPKTMTAKPPPEDPSPPPGTTSTTPRRPIFQTETTGDYWSDVREAFKVRRRSMRALALTVPTRRLTHWCTSRDCRHVKTWSALVKSHARGTVS